MNAGMKSEANDERSMEERLNDDDVYVYVWETRDVV